MDLAPPIGNRVAGGVEPSSGPYQLPQGTGKDRKGLDGHGLALWARQRAQEGDGEGNVNNVIKACLDVSDRLI